jgi:diguanylate cyclase (GGDEF)-like protein/putative nucleotidyltransferase with HDIG domain
MVGAVVAVAIDTPPRDLRAVLLVGFAVAAGLVKVPLPVVGSLSLSYAFVFATLMELGLGASAMTGVLCALFSSLVRSSRDRAHPHRMLFNGGLIGLTALVAGLAYLALGGNVGMVDPLIDLVPILGYTVTFALVNIGLLSLAIHFAGEDRASLSWRSNLRWSVPGYAAGSALATLVSLLATSENLALLLLAAPFAYLVHMAYRARTQQVHRETRHSQKTAELYRSVTEALARAIEAKDEHTEEHLERVKEYCLGIGEHLDLGDEQMEALRAASLLHDIGKIAVPEYILSKPGRLTPEEAEKMMIHPRVGAEILSAVPFPYPLAPIVRHHHERWDGNGYPDRLAGAAIPLGARVLSVVDCYDALTSDRPYRNALSREEALAHLRREAGRMFDPAVVEILLDHVDELEERVIRVSGDRFPIMRAATGRARGPESTSGETEVYQEITAATRELQTLYDMARTVGHHLDFEECLTVLSAKLAALTPYRSLVVYLFDEERRNVVARFVTGAAEDRLRGLKISMGEKLAGWVALHQRPYVGRAHVNPLDRDGSRTDLESLAEDPEVAALRSALVVPLSTDREQLGVLALYHEDDFTYEAEHRRLVTAVAGHMAQAIRNSLVYGQARSLSLTDPVTGLPGSRFFFMEAEHRISRAMSGETGFGVVAVRLTCRAAILETYGERAAERLVSIFARRLAASCGTGETAVRFGAELFLVLTGIATAQDLVARCHALVEDLRETPIEVRLGVTADVEVLAAQAIYPVDGCTPDDLLDAVEGRLSSLRRGRGEVVAFPSMDSIGLDAS